jgi:putative oxidoreductase
VTQTLNAWEGQARSILRVIAAFMLFLHGLRETFGFPLAGRTRGAPMALDGFGAVAGIVLLIGGALLFMGLRTRLVAGILSVQTAAAYIFVAASHGPLPMHNGGEEVIIYTLLLVYFAFAGAGTWSVDAMFRRGKIKSAEETR